MHDFGKRISECTDGMVFVIMDEIAKKSGAFAGDVDGWKVFAT